MVKGREYYRIKLHKVEDLKEGKTVNYIVNLTGYSRQYFSDVINGKYYINKKTAERIILSLAKESIKISNMIKLYGLERTIENYFEKVQ